MKKYCFPPFLILSICLSLSCEKNVYTGTVEVEYFENGKIFIDSKPNGAQIFVDNKNSGLSTPDTIPWLQSGSHSVTLKKYLFQDTTVTIQVKDREVSSAFVDFTLNSKNFGKIECNSTPSGSDIYLNDSLTGNKTPAILSYLYPGDYKIKYTHDEHRADSTTVLVKSSEIAKVNITLEDTSKWVSYNTDNSQIMSDYITSITHAGNNNIWLGSGSGLIFFDGRNWQLFNSRNTQLKTDAINCISVGPDNRKWIGTANGLYVIDDNVWIDYTSNLPNNVAITTIIFNNKGDAIIGTTNGLVIKSETKWEILNSSNSGLKDNTITCLTIDKLNRLWIGTFYGGLNIYDGSSWSYFDNTNMKVNYFEGFPKTIAVDERGTVWVSIEVDIGKDGKLFFYDNSKWTQYFNVGLTFNLTLALFSKNDYLVFGSKRGVGLLKTDGSFIFFEKGNYALGYLRTESVTIDDHGNLWLATFGNGLAKLKKGNF